MNSLWILFACGVACAYADPLCDNLFRECDNPDTYGDFQDTFVTYLEDLQTKCSRNQPTINCHVDVMKKCSVNMPESDKDYYFNFKSFLDKLCVPGDYQTMYLKNAQCLNDVIQWKTITCTTRAVNEAEYGSCEFRKSVDRCIEPYVRNYCGEEAGDIYTEVYSQRHLRDADCMEHRV